MYTHMILCKHSCDGTLCVFVSSFTAGPSGNADWNCVNVARRSNEKNLSRFLFLMIDVYIGTILWGILIREKANLGEKIFAGPSVWELNI